MHLVLSQYKLEISLYPSFIKGWCRHVVIRCNNAVISCGDDVIVDFNVVFL